MHQTPLARIAPRCIPILLLLMAGCSADAATPDPTWPAAIPTGGDTDARKREQAVAALVAVRAAPRDEQRIIWYGRRIAYLGLYDDAIEIYSKGLKVHPESPRLLRHRGHRYISLRRFRDAITDFDRARRMIEVAADEVEPDGMPNARNIPTSTLHTNIWYHYGLAHYCRGEFAAALRHYKQCLAAAKNPDMEVATRYWLFLTATRLDQKDEAARYLAPVRADWDVIENHAYHQLLLLYRGEKTRADMRSSGDAIKDKTMGYGLARHLFLIGDTAAGEAALREVAAGGSPAFGSIAAEADLKR